VRRLLATLFVAAMLLALVPMGAAAQGLSVAAEFTTFFDVIMDPDRADAQGVVAITEDGEVFDLAEGHAPIKDGMVVIDFGMARRSIDDSNDGADAGLDITRGWGNLVHSSEALSRYIGTSFAEITLPPGFFSAHDGTAPAFPQESVVVGVETDVPVAEEIEPPGFEIILPFQLSMGFMRAGIPAYASDDSNGGHNATIDSWSNGTAGTDAYEILNRSFINRSTGFFGRAHGNWLSMAGPWGELDGADRFVANIVDWPNFDGVELGDLSDFGIITAYMWNEMDLNGDGVYDPLEVAETATEEPATEEPPTEEPATEEPPTEEPPAEEPPADGPAAADPASTSDDDGGGSSLGLLLIAIAVAFGGFGLWLFLKRREKCVPEAEALAAADARLADANAAVEKAKAAVDKAREHLQYTEDNASEQRELRLVEAQQGVNAAESELARAEGQRSDASAEREAAQYVYDVCMGFVTPEPEPEPEPPPPVVPPPPETPEAPEPPPVVDDGPGQPGVTDPGIIDDGDPPPPIPPPKPKPECADGQKREVEESVGSFTVPVDGVVRLALATSRGPVDDLEAMVSGTPIADLIADQVAGVLSPTSLSLSGNGLSSGSARSLQSGFETMAGLARTDIEVVIEYDLEDVSLACIRLEECQSEHWVTVGHRLEERGRSQRTVTARWATLDSRPLGATFTSVRRGLDNASSSKADMDKFTSSCK
jgi:hypothetical protein